MESLSTRKGQGALRGGGRTTLRGALRSVRWIGAAAALYACGSGADSSPPAVDRVPDGFWPRHDGGALDPAQSEILAVSGGNIRLGAWRFDSSAAALRPNACHAGLSSRTDRVSSFRMMRLEVSFGTYAACVRSGRCEVPDGDLTHDPRGAGAWDDPSRANQPAAVSYFRARAFCLAVGGDLPTYSQWIRATEGDAGAFGIKELTDAYVRCSLGQASPLCSAVESASWLYPRGDPQKVYRPLPDVGTNDWDVGPYGHRDMFGSAAEWVRGYAKQPPLGCSPPHLDDNYYVPYADPPRDVPMSLMHIARDLLVQGPLSAPDAALVVTVLQGSGTSENAGTGRFYTGFRCAFPPTQ